MLQITWTTQDPSPIANQLLVVPCLQMDPDTVAERFGAPVGEAFARAGLKGKSGETFSFTRVGSSGLEWVCLLRVTDPRDAAQVRKLAYDAIRQGDTHGASRLVIDLRAEGDPWGCAEASAPHLGDTLAQGCVLGQYAYESFVSEHGRGRRTVEEVVFVAKGTAAQEGALRGSIIAESIARARDLVNGPAALVTPTYLAATATSIAKSLQADHDVSVKVLEREECAAQKMGCFLGVAQGSDEPPKFIHLTYKPRQQSKGRVVLVGKGVTFDSGGYSLKPSDGMLDMKMDMAGAAAVIGAFEAIVRLNLPWEVHTLVAATENMVSGHAYRLGDILTASNGKTVEINNTDAEGRLTLADAMVYGSKLNPDFMLDFATLTGACMVALGPHIAGVMSKDDALAEDWIAAGKRCGESMWRLPLPDDLREQLKSKVADMKNTGERWGGALTAGLFLSDFCENVPWLHVDLAGPAMASKPYGVTGAGGTGFAVASIVEFLSGTPRTTAKAQ